MYAQRECEYHRHLPKATYKHCRQLINVLCCVVQLYSNFALLAKANILAEVDSNSTCLVNGFVIYIFILLLPW